MYFILGFFFKPLKELQRGFIEWNTNSVLGNFFQYECLFTFLEPREWFIDNLYSFLVIYLLLFCAVKSELADSDAKGVFKVSEIFKECLCQFCTPPPMTEQGFEPWPHESQSITLSTTPHWVSI